jgi:uncharacterized protein YfaS (alpha-2-macroglobulin family)
VGRAEKAYVTQLPLSLSTKVPIEVSMGDRVTIPLMLKNNSPGVIIGTLNVHSPACWKPVGITDIDQRIEPGVTKTLSLVYDVLNKPGKDFIEISFHTERLSDAFRQEVDVVERGFPQSLSYSGNEREKSFVPLLTRPVDGTLKCRLTVFPSVTSDIIAGIDAILREPCGCFEQTSGSNYPNAIALRYLEANGINDVALISRAKNLLDDGYKKLVAFETKDKGYEWFGQSPPHEALTAYGLMEFKDMEPVYASVDKSMVDRTAKWLLGRRDGKGKFLRDQKAIDSFGRANDEVSNAYIVYALTEAGYTDIKQEYAASYQTALASNDPYQLALMANASVNMKSKDQTQRLLAVLLHAQENDGSWTGTTHSITQSTGISLKTETTSLAVLALLKTGNPDGNALSNAVKYILSSRSGYGGFGSTQGTILALKALAEYATYSKQTSEAGDVYVEVGGKRVASRHYEKGERDPIVLDGIEKYLDAAGVAQQVTIGMGDTKHPLPYTFLASWNTDLPLSSDSVKVGLKTKFSRDTIRTGETIRLTTELSNLTATGLPMTMVMIGIPGGLSPQPWQLKELQEKHLFDFYEIKGRYIALYYRQILPLEKKIINLDLKADFPGTYESPASCGYLYYTNEHKAWTAAQKVTVMR